MTPFVRQRRPRMGPVLGLLVSRAPFANRAAAKAAIRNPDLRCGAEQARRALDLAIRRDLLVELADGRIVRAYRAVEVPR